MHTLFKTFQGCGGFIETNPEEWLTSCLGQASQVPMMFFSAFFQTVIVNKRVVTTSSDVATYLVGHPQMVV